MTLTPIIPRETCELASESFLKSTPRPNLPRCQSTFIDTAHLHTSPSSVIWIYSISSFAMFGITLEPGDREAVTFVGLIFLGLVFAVRRFMENRERTYLSEPHELELISTNRTSGLGPRQITSLPRLDTSLSPLDTSPFSEDTSPTSQYTSSSSQYTSPYSQYTFLSSRYTSPSSLDMSPSSLDMSPSSLDTPLSPQDTAQPHKRGNPPPKYIIDTLGEDEYDGCLPISDLADHYHEAATEEYQWKSHKKKCHAELPGPFWCHDRFYKTRIPKNM